MGRFVNQDSDQSNKDRFVSQDSNSRDSETLSGHFVNLPDVKSQQSELGKVRSSDGSSDVEQPPQFTNTVLRGHFTQTDLPSYTDQKQEQNLYDQEAGEYQDQSFQDYDQEGFQIQDASTSDPHSTQLQLESANIAVQKLPAPGL